MSCEFGLPSAKRFDASKARPLTLLHYSPNGWDKTYALKHVAQVRVPHFFASGGQADPAPPAPSLALLSTHHQRPSLSPPSATDSNTTQENFKEIHFFGDKTYKGERFLPPSSSLLAPPISATLTSRATGGNDYEIYTSEATIGHSVTCPEDTIRELKALFDI